LTHWVFTFSGGNLPTGKAGPTTSQQRDVIRARIILGCAESKSAKRVSKQVGVSSRTVERWRSRFLLDGLDGLNDKYRRGHKPKYGPVTRLELIGLACEPVPTHDGKTTRTIDELVTEAVSRKMVDSISWSSYQRILAEIDLRPHLIQGWVHSPDPQFREKVAEITELYLNPPPNSVVLSIDEKTGMQALQRRFPDRPAGPGRRHRREFEYKRHGTQSLLCSFDVHSGHVEADCGATRTGDDLLHLMEKIAARYPTGTVYGVKTQLTRPGDG
jgi:transposase